MAINISKQLNKQARAEDKILLNLQRYFEKETKSLKADPSKYIVLSIGGKEEPAENLKRAVKYAHNISWDDIADSYKRKELIGSLLLDEYLKENKDYGGRRLFQQFDKNNLAVKYINGEKIIAGTGSKLLKDIETSLGWAGKYLPIDKSIHQRVLSKIYNDLYKETNKQLLDKFETIKLGDGEKAFDSLIKVTNELVFDLNKKKGWVKEVEQLVNSARIKYKQMLREQTGVFEHLGADTKSTNRWILTREQLVSIGKAILGRATELCPIETGFLRSSGKVYVNNDSIRIIYEAPYAAYVHDNPNNQHTFGKYHFLIDAAHEVLPYVSIWTENTGDDSMVAGTYMKQSWEHDKFGRVTSDMYWKETFGYRTVYIDIDRNLRINYVHYKKEQDY